MKEKVLSNKLFWSIAGGIIFLAVLTRFLFLGDKPLHHDESLHAYYSARVAEGEPHIYSALLHGPFLYYFVSLFYRIFGNSEFGIRFPAALFGVLVVAIPLMLYKHIGKFATLILMTLLLISPSTMYFGRFLREDVFCSIWVLGTVFGVFIYWQTRTLWSIYFAVAMLAFHFTNKENSFLHTFIWFAAIMGIVFFEQIFYGIRHTFAWVKKRDVLIDRVLLILNCLSIFWVIFILFFSAFFRHRNGPWAGVIDGIYRESLMYWIDQNSKRRIDGPFDYHLPILANYEFLLLPFLFTAWIRIIKLANIVSQKTPELILGIWSKLFKNLKLCYGIFILLMLAVFLIPAVTIIDNGACPYGYCITNVTLASIVKTLHFSNSRQFLQIICYIVLGGMAFLAANISRRKMDAFLWFWLTGAIGTYSYVGEKVPWLVVYIVLPLILICGAELVRFLTGKELDFYKEIPVEQAGYFTVFTKKYYKFAVVWLILAAPFTIFKALRASIPNAANPVERFVFTQTTPEITQIRDRWWQVEKSNPGYQTKVTVMGDSSWPMSWYIKAFPKSYYTDKLPTETDANKLDGMYLDERDLETIKKKYTNFNIYIVPLRAWWVPSPNPNLLQILKYFFTEELYDTGAGFGTGAQNVIYVERIDSKLAAAGHPPGIKIAQEGHALPPGPIINTVPGAVAVPPMLAPSSTVSHN